MNQSQLSSMFKTIDQFYDDKQKLYAQLDNGKISFDEFRKLNNQLDNDLDLHTRKEYNENEEMSLHELVVFSNKK